MYKAPCTHKHLICRLASLPPPFTNVTISLEHIRTFVLKYLAGDKPGA